VTPRRPIAIDCIVISLEALVLIMSTYDSSSKQKDSCEAIDGGHDQARYFVDPDCGDADDGYDQSEGTGKGTVRSRSWGFAIHLPVYRIHGYAQHDSREKSLDSTYYQCCEHIDVECVDCLVSKEMSTLCDDDW
jgi:hypothetical protein